VATGAESRSAWGAVVLGVLGVAALPVAVFATRYSASYDLLHAGIAIPVSLALGLGAVIGARRARRRQALSLRGEDPVRGAALGWGLGVAGIALAASATVALAVYGVLTWLGERGT
jgi:hypothetical protein